MTTNQTIDGVPRAALVNLLSEPRPDAPHCVLEARAVLRALLDAPVLVPPKRLGVHHVLGAIHNVPGFPGVKGNHIHDLTALLNGFLDESAAQPQPQGEPVGFRYRAHGGPWELMPESPFADGRTHHRENGEELQPVYAEQPAPVAVVPERANAGHGSHDHQSGWNACLDELKRLNTSL